MWTFINCFDTQHLKSLSLCGRFTTLWVLGEAEPASYRKSQIGSQPSLQIRHNKYVTWVPPIGLTHPELETRDSRWDEARVTGHLLAAAILCPVLRGSVVRFSCPHQSPVLLAVDVSCSVCVQWWLLRAGSAAWVLGWPPDWPSSPSGYPVICPVSY